MERGMTCAIWCRSGQETIAGLQGADIYEIVPSVSRALRMPSAIYTMFEYRFQIEVNP